MSTDGPTEEACGFDGNQDLYGLGVRIAFYLQAVAVEVSYLSKGERSKAIAIYQWFVLALMITLVYMTATSQVYAVEAYICLMMGGMRHSLGHSSWLIMRIRHGDRPDAAEVGRSSFLAGAGKYLLDYSHLVYSCWFWWKGLYVLKASPCGSFGFFFTQTPLDGWLRVLFLTWKTYQVLNGVVLLVWVMVKGFCVVSRRDVWRLPAGVWAYVGEWPAWLVDPEPDKYEGYVELRNHFRGRPRAAGLPDGQSSSESDNGGHCDSKGSSGNTHVSDRRRLPNKEEAEAEQDSDQLEPGGRAIATKNDRFTSPPRRSGAKHQARATTWACSHNGAQRGHQEPDLERGSLLASAQPIDGVTAEFSTTSAKEKPKLIPAKGWNPKALSLKGWVVLLLSALGAMAMTLGASAILLFHILAVELSIRYNGISGTGDLFTAGQLIAFMVGLGGLCQAVVQIYLRLVALTNDKL